jgi:predicted nucleotidyltransferase
MNRDQLRESHPEIQERFGVASLSLFGSASRDELRGDSDIDVLVSFDGPATADRYFGLKGYLEDLMGRHVDLATDKMFKPRLRRRVEGEILRVA